MKVFLALLVVILFLVALSKGWSGVWVAILSVGFVLARAYLHGAFARSFYGKEDER